MADENNAAEENAENAGPEMAIQRVYVKDMSYETPGVPDIFRDQWQPDMDLDMQTSSNKLEDDVYEVVLGVTVTVKSDEKTAFLIEVKYGGIFTVKGFEPQQLHAVLGSVCPSILFPYAREVVSDIVSKGSFPQLLLAPVNFEALYQQHLQQQTKQQGEGEATVN